MIIDLSGRTAVVTGGNGGIGLGIVRALLNSGADVAIWARNMAKSAAAIDEIGHAGGRVIAVECDVLQSVQIDAAMRSTVEQLGGVDIFVANSGVAHFSPLQDMDEGDWNRVIGTNLTGAFLCFRAATRHLLARETTGCLIAVSSVAAMHAAPNMAHYAAAKAGILALVRSTAAELAPHGIRVNALTPGWTEIERLNPRIVDSDLASATLASIPAGRWATAAELGQAAVFLADVAMSMHTGTNLIVDGGYSSMPPYIAALAARAAVEETDEAAR
jgi:NAD(P)-dependent dehydrogenase (short-subunit alcohol dehydrogenase family)